MEQGEIGDPHGIVGPHAPYDADDNEVIIGVRNSHIGGSESPNDDNEGEDDGGSGSDNGSNDQVPGDPLGWPQRPRRSRGHHWPVESQGSIGPVAPASINLHVKCPIFPAKDVEGTESHLLYRNDWMNSQGTVQEAKCGRFHLTPGGDAHLWYESITPVGNDWNKFTDNSLNWENTRRTVSKVEFITVWWNNWHNWLLCSKVETCAQMLGYNEGQVLEHFKNTLPTKNYYLLLGIETQEKWLRVLSMFWQKKY